MRKSQVCSLSAALAGVLVAADVQAQLVNRFSFDETSGTTAVDTAGGQNGTLVNGAVFTGTGSVNTQVDGDGSGATAAAVSLPSGILSGLTMGGTIEVFGTFNNPDPAFQTLFSFSDGTTGNFLISQPRRGEGGFPNIGTAAVGTNVGGGGENLVVSPTPLAIGQPFQLAVTFDGTTSRLFINGTEVDDSANTFVPSLLGSTTLNGIGGLAPFGDQSFQGTINEFRIFDRALTAGELSAEFAAGPDAVAVPEPASLGLLALGGLLALRRRGRA